MKKKVGIVVVATMMAVGVVAISRTNLSAGQFDDEAWWTNYCSEYIDISDTKKKEDCMNYQQYLRDKKGNASAQAAETQNKINEIANDAAKLADLSKQLQAQIEQINANIVAKEQAIIDMEASIRVVEENIVIREGKVEERKNLIKERMVKVQVTMNTNQYFDFMMGAKDLIDLISRAKSIQEFTEYDSELLDALYEEMANLQLEKDEKKRLNDTMIAEKDGLEADKANVEVKKQENDAVIAEYRKQEAELVAQKMQFDSAVRAADENMPSLRFTNGNVPEINSDGFLVNFVSGGRRTAGTWAYPGGGTHLGIDIGAPLRSPIVAPADSIVLYANNPVGTNSGFLGNWSGYPIGGGNTVLLLMSVNGQTYAMQFAHLAQEGMVALSQATINQGEVFALLGNSGNTSGPHVHVEVYQLSISVQEAVQVWNTTRDFTFGTGWGAGGVNGSSRYGQRIRPEAIFGY